MLAANHQFRTGTGCRLRTAFHRGAVWVARFTLPWLVGATLLSAQAQSGTAVIRHAPSVQGRVEGTIHQLSAEPFTLEGSGTITGDLLVPGTPVVRINGSPSFGGTIDGSGVAEPSTYVLTLGGNAALGRIVRRTDPVLLAPVPGPLPPAGMRVVNLRNGSDDPGPFATIRDLTVGGNAGQIVVPPGAYGEFTAAGGSGFTFGMSGTAQPAVYHFQRLVLHGRAEIRVLGPVVLNLAQGIVTGGVVGDPANPGWLALNVHAGGVGIEGGGTVSAFVNVPGGTATIDGNGRLVGGLTADRLAVQGGGVLRLTNRAPVAMGGAATVAEDGSIQIMLTASDGDGDRLTFTVVAPPAHGVITGVAPNLTYTPAANYAGPDRLTFSAHDGHVASNVAAIAITVTPVNDAPIADAVTLTVAEDTPGVITLAGRDVDGDALTFTVISPPAHGTVSGDGSRRTYTPAPNFFGADAFRYVASDGALSSQPAAVEVTVTPANDAPTAVAQTVAAVAGTPLGITLAGLDPDGDVLTYTIVSGPTSGTIAGSPPRLTYTAAADYTGQDSFAFVVNDGRLGSSPGTVNISVAPPPNRPPRITSTPVAVMELRGEAGGPGLLRGTIRDFSRQHPNFEENLNQTSTFVVPGIVAPFIGADRKPIPLHLGQGGSSTDTADNFNQWYRDVPGVNYSRQLELPIAETAPGSGIYGYRSDAFFPIDNEFYGHEGLSDGQLLHNFNFTCEYHTRFVYRPGQTITFGGDDAVWVFVDDRLVIDLGGVHLSTEATAGLDDLGLVPGRSYPIDIFHAEQHTGGSSFRLRTSMAFETTEIYRYAVQAVDPDGNVLAYSLTQAPAGMSIDPQTGLITWVLDRAAIGSHPITIEVRDPGGLAATQSYALNVYVNAPPAIAWGSRYHVGRVGEPVPLAAVVTDDGHPGGQPLIHTWSRVSGPGEVVFLPASAPTTAATFSAAGLHVVQLRVSDGARESSSTVEVRIDTVTASMTGRQATSWWPGNDTPEDVVGGRHGEPLFGASYAAGVVGSAFVFDGVNDIVRVRSNPDLDLGAAPTGFSLEFWMRCEIDNPMGALIGWRTVTGEYGPTISLDNYLGTRRVLLSLRRPDSTTITVSGEQLWTLNEWVHLAFTYDRPAGVVRIYRDGALRVEQVVGPLALQTAMDLWWGGVTGFNGNFFRGRLDEFAIYRRPLSSAEVYASFAASSAGNLPPSGNQPPNVDAGADLAPRSVGQPIMLAGTVSDDGRPSNSALRTQWSFVSGPSAPVIAAPSSLVTAASLPASGTYVFKLSASDGEASSEDLVQVKVGQIVAGRPFGLAAWWPGNDSAAEAVAGLHGTWTNRPVYAAGAVSSAFAFDGERRVTVPATPALNADGWPGLSLEFWLRPTTPASGSGVFLGWRNATGAMGVALRVGYFWGWFLAVDLPDTGGAAHSLSVNGLALDEWQHWVVSYDRASGVARVYRNGSEVHETVLGSFAPQTAWDLHWGNVTDASFRGCLDEISLYRRALTSDEAYRLYDAAAAGKEATGPNLPPVVNAGPDRIVRSIAQPITLAGTASDDALPAGNGMALRWSKRSGPGAVNFAGAADAATTATVDRPGIYVLQLEADDGLTRSADLVEVRVGPFAVADTAADIVGWWPGNHTTDDVVGGLAAHWVGAPAYESGLVGGAFAFNGAGHLRVPASAGLDAAAWQGLSLEFWARPAGMPPVGHAAPLLEWRHPNGQSGVSVTMAYRYGWNLNVQLMDTRGQPHSLGLEQAFAGDAWQHFVVTYDRASGRAQVFRDGQLSAEANLGSFTPQTTYDLLLGRPGDARFLGRIDELAIYRRALAAREVAAVYTAAGWGRSRPAENVAPVVDAGADQLIPSIATAITLSGSVSDDGRPFGEITTEWAVISAPAGATVTFAAPGAAATSATVSMPGTYLLQLTASDGYAPPVADVVELRVAPGAADSPPDLAAWWPANATPTEVVGRHDAELVNGATYATGRVLQGFAFDGVASFVRVNGHADLDVGASASGMTIEFWARWDLAGDKPLFAWSGENGGTDFVRGWTQSSGRAVSVWLRGTDGQDRGLIGPATLTAGQFVHLAVTYDRTTGVARLYYDGRLAREGSFDAFTPDTRPTRRLWIGSRHDTRTFKGIVDEFTLYRRALGPGEIAAIAAAAGGGKAPPDNNSPPAAFAGPDVASPDTATPVALSGTITDDGRPFGAPAAEWRVLAGPGSATFATPDSATTAATFDTPGTYLLELAGSDRLLAPVTDTVEVRVGVAAVEPPAGISAWWPGNLHGSDVIGGHATLSLGNGAGYAAGRVLHGFSFDGADDYARAPAHADIDIGASESGFTIEFWVRPAANRDGMILSWGDATAAGLAVYQCGQGRELEVNFRDRSTGADRTLRAGGEWLTGGQWTHVAITHDRASGEMRIYIDGVVRAAGFLGAAPVRTQFGMTLGRHAWDGEFPWPGIVDEPALYRRPLNPEEIAALYAAGGDGKSPPDQNASPVVDAGPDIALAGPGDTAVLDGRVTDDNRPFGPPVVSWRMVAGPGAVTFANAAAATTATFAVPGTYLLELIGSDRYTAPVSDRVEVRVGVATAETAAGISAWWPANQSRAEMINARAPADLMFGAGYGPGRVLSGWVFDGVDDIVRVPAHADIDLGASAAGFSVEFWVKPAANHDGMILSWGAPNSAGLALYQYGLGRELEVNFRDRTTGADRTLRTTGLALTGGQWTHLAVTQDRAIGEIRLYANGAMRASALNASFAVCTQGALVFGRHAWDAAFPWKGTVDEVALYQRALGPEEVARIYAAGGDGKSPRAFNEPPMVSAGPDIAVSAAGIAATFNGTVLDDGRPFGAPLVEWTLVDGPGTVSFGNAASARTSATFSAAGTYLLKLTATDRFVLPVSDLAEVRVGVSTTPAPAPIAAWWPGNGHPREMVNGNRSLELFNGAGYGTGRVSQGFLFDGDDDEARALAHPDFHVGASELGFTLEFWVRPDRVNQGEFPLVTWHSGTAQGLAVRAVSNGTQPSLLLRYAEGGGTDVHPGALLAGREGQWIHLAYTYERVTGTVGVYRDGVLVTQQTASANRTVRTDYPLWLGRSPDGGAFKGVLDELTLYRRALTATEIAAIHAAGAGGKTPVNTNQPPMVFAGADTMGYTNGALPLAGIAVDDGRPNPPASLSYQWSRISGPGDVTFSAATSLLTTATFTTAGTHTLRLAASDSALSAMDDVVVRVVNPASQPPAVALVQPRHGGSVPASLPVNLVATASDPDGTITQVEFLRDGTRLGPGAPVAGQPGCYSLATTFAADASTVVLAARATDNTGVTITSLPVTVSVVADPGPPFAEIITPAEDARITAPLTIHGVAASPLLAGWTLEHRLKVSDGAAPEPWTSFASGGASIGVAPAGPTPAVPGPLGTFDPTRLLNGIYELRLTATDTAGRISVAGPSTVVVEGNLKIGAFALAFEDLKVPLAGIPITLTRTYDSRDGRAGDFGPGWRLALNNIRVQKNRHLGLGWWQTLQQGSGLQFYFVEPVRERIVTVVMPDGETHRFRAGALVRNREGDPENASFAVVARQGRYRFHPIGDTTSRLEPLDAANQLAESFFIGGTGEQDLTFDEFGFSPFNTSRYRLTTRDGTVFIVDEVLGLLEVRDTNGNTLVLNRDPQNRVEAVTSTQMTSAGAIARRIAIVRDTTGRVDYIRDSAGRDLDYLYDPQGRLSSFVNRELNVTQFRYELSDTPGHPRFHYLTQIIDPRGVAALRSEYDPVTGRLVKQIDHEGRATVFAGGVDTTGRFEKITDRLGHETTFYYDDRGNVTLKVDPLGAQTVYHYYPDSDRPKFEVDHYGNVRSLAYDERGNLTAETLGAAVSEDPAAPSVGFTTRTIYNACSAPTRITDADGRHQVFAYDSATNNLLAHTLAASSTDPAAGDTTRYAYNADGTLATVTDPLGNVTSRACNHAFNHPNYPGAVKEITVTVTDPAGRIGLDSGNASDITLRQSRSLYDVHENRLAEIIRRTLPDGTAEDVVTRFEYDAENRLKAVILPDGRVTETRYTAVGKQDKVAVWKSVADYRAHDDGNARITAFGYDSRGNRTSVTYADGTSELGGFDAENRRVWTQDRRGYRTFFVHDATGRLRYTVYPDTNDGVGAAAPNSADDPRLADNPRTETQYDLLGRVRFQVDERGAKTELTYEDNGGGFRWPRQAIQHRLPGNLTTQYAYDRSGNVRFVTDPGGHTVETRYDDRGQPRFRVYPATDEHPVTQIEARYDARGRCVEAIDPEGRTMRYRYDALGRLAEVRQYLDPAAAGADADLSLVPSDPRIAITRYTYDELDNQTTQVDALGRVTRYESDSAGRRTKRSLPHDSSDASQLFESYVYDGWGNLRQRTDFAGKTTTFGYDVLDRLTSQSADPTHPSLGYTHAIARIEFEYDPNGARRAARAYNAANTLLYVEVTPRDERGRPAFKDAGAIGRLDYSYHPNGLLKDVVSSNPAGVNTGYRFDELNRLQYVDDASGGVPGRMTVYSYAPTGAVEEVTHPNGIVHAYAYDSLNRLRTLQVRVGTASTNGPSAGTVHHAYEYKLRPSGHRRQVFETLASAPATMSAPRTTSYEYDPIYRLVSEAVIGDPGGTNGSVSYTLDKVGNRLARASGLPPIASQPGLTYNPRDWLNGDTYNPNGSTVRGGTGVSPAGSFTDAYDFEERLIARTWPDGTSIHLLHDADGHPIGKNIQGAAGAPIASSTWLVDSNNLTGYAQVLEERVSTAATGTAPAASRTVVYTYGRDLISQAASVDGGLAVVRYVGRDGHGSTRELMDPSGNVTDRYDYDAFGLVTYRSGSTTNDHLYAAERYDPDLGLYHLRARYLNPETGRFWTMDGNEGSADDPPSLHKYAYANANPVTFTDPSGEVSLAEVKIGMVIVSTLNSMALNAGRNTISQANGIFNPTGDVNNALATLEQAMFIAEEVNLAAAAGGAGALAARAGAIALNALTPKVTKAAATLAQASPAKIVQAQVGRFGFPDRFSGVRNASKYLQQMAVPRSQRVRILQSFEVDAISVRGVRNPEFGLRYFSDPRRTAGSYLFETFPASRQSLALRPEWSTMIGVRQFMLRPGATVLEGPASTQGAYLPGGQVQKFVLDWKHDLLDP